MEAVEYTVKDFEDVMIIRNQLECDTPANLCEFYSDMDNYLEFIHAMTVFSQVDGAFLLYRRDYIDTVERILQVHRFDGDREKVWGPVNDLVLYLNELKGYTPDLVNMLKNGYLAYQEDCRKTPFTDEDEFLYSMSYDAVVLWALKNEGNLDSITESDMFLASINYLIETLPETFESKEVSKKVMDKLSELESAGWPFKRELREYSKETKEAFQKLKIAFGE